MICQSCKHPSHAGRECGEFVVTVMRPGRCGIGRPCKCAGPTKQGTLFGETAPLPVDPDEPPRRDR